MAERRMFAKTIIDSDAFLEMPLSTQALYFHLSMRADDDGFVNNPKKVQRVIGATDDDLKILIAKSFVLVFESGVIVIKHWRINNYIRNDRYKGTVYTEEKELLSVKENGSYTLGIPTDNQTVYQMDTQYRLGKVSKEKNIYIVEIEKIIEYLNQVLGTKYTVKSKSTCEKITARLKEGHTFDDFKTVIDKKFRQWGNDPKMSKFLRPETLFAASHFESYLNEIEAEETKKPSQTANKKIHNFEERKIDYDELLKQMGVIGGS